MAECNKKLGCSVKFIDFFVHDILDYTLLMKQQSNFMKNNTVFNIKEAMNEIVDIF